MSGEVSTGLIQSNKRTAIATLDKTARQARMEIAEARAAGDDFALAFTTAAAMRQLRQQLTPELMGDVKALMNSRLGFKTDRGPGCKKETPYSDEVVRDCFVEAMLKGSRPVGNEFNILAGNCYQTLEFYQRAVREVPSVTEYREQYSVPERGQKGARVACKASWKKDGKPDSLCMLKTAEDDFRVSIRLYETDTDDLLLGKAKRKFLARVLAQMTGAAADDTDPDDQHSLIVDHDPTVARIESHGADETRPEPDTPAGLNIDAMRAAMDAAKTADDVRRVGAEHGPTCSNQDELDELDRQFTLAMARVNPKGKQKELTA
jgi:hypothetical protein